MREQAGEESGQGVSDQGCRGMKIVVLDGYTLNPGDLSWEPLERLGELTVYERTPSELVCARIGDADAVFTNKTLLGAEHFAQRPRLRFVGVLATGYNVVDLAAARSAGIAVCNVPDYGTMAVAQYATALLLELCHRVGAHSDDVRAGGWSRSADFCYWRHPLVELAGKTLGIVGYGRIGQAFARVAQALGMRVVVHTRTVDAARQQCAPGSPEFVGLDELYAQSDVISLHCPLTSDNKGMIDARSIAAMRRGVLLINTARGPLIVEDDLAAALASGQVGGAALDVLGSEPPAADNPLLAAPNCLVTPHIAWGAREARQRIMHTAADNLACFLAGTPQNVVNP